MNKTDYDNFIDPSELSLDSILAEYKAESYAEAARTAQPSRQERSRRLVLEILDETMSGRIRDPEPEAQKTMHTPEPQTSAAPEPEPAAAAQEAPEPPVADAAPDTEPHGYSDVAADGYAAADYPEYEDEDVQSAPERKHTARQFRPSRISSFTAPFLALLALITVRRQQRAQAEPNREAEQEEDWIPELSPKKAAKLYASQAAPFKLRGILAAVLSIILVYISYGLPMPASVSGNIRVASMLCMALELVVVLIGLDVFTNGITSLLRGKPGAETLIAASCLFSVIDAAVIAITGNSSWGLPFCGVSALSMTFAIWGSRLLCSGLRSTYRAAAMGSSPYTITAEKDITDEVVMMKSRRDLTGFVRRSEGADFCESAYAAAAPFLMIACLVFALLASVIRGRADSFFHCAAGLFAASASFSALLSFSLPFSIVAKQLVGSGAALAGWAGVSDIGKSRRIMITDSDIFPTGTVRIETIRILEGTFTDKVISFAGSMMIACGCGLTPSFAELMKRNGCAMHPVEDFRCHEGGGLMATIRGEQVYMGPSGFMNLMGIRLPQSQISKNAVFIAISGVLVGVFNTGYTPTASVQDALVSLLHARGTAPLFAIRDFNINPLLIKQKFRMPTEGFDFPSVAERYRISAAEAKADSPPAAILTREGLAPMVEAATCGRRLYKGSLLASVLSLMGTFLGLVLMFFLCWSGSFEAGCVGNMLSFMLLWLVPLIVIAIGLRR